MVVSEVGTGTQQRWVDMSWGIYIWLSIVAVTGAFVNVVSQEDHLFDILRRVTNDKIFLTCITHFLLLMIVAIIYGIIKFTLGEIRETERENTIERCNSLIVDWIIFLVFARPSYDGRPATVLRLAYAFVYLMAMRIIHQLLKLRTSAMGDYRPELQKMIRIVIMSVILSIINGIVANKCIKLYEEQTKFEPAATITPFIQSALSCLNALGKMYDDEHFYDFCAQYLPKHLAQTLLKFDYPILRPVVIIIFFKINMVRLLCPQYIVKLLRLLTDYRFGALSWFVFESSLLSLEAAFSAMKGVMFIFNFALQNLVQRTWRDLTIINIFTDLILDLILSMMSILWIISLMIAGSLKGLLGVPFFMLTEMIQNIVGVYNSCLSLYRYSAMEAFLNKFPKANLEQLEAQDACIVCRETLYLNSGDPVLLTCSHVFHYACLKNWYTQQQTCPTCRAVIDPTNKMDSSPRSSENQRAGQVNANTTTDPFDTTTGGGSTETTTTAAAAASRTTTMDVSRVVGGIPTGSVVTSDQIINDRENVTSFLATLIGQNESADMEMKAIFSSLKTAVEYQIRSKSDDSRLTDEDVKEVNELIEVMDDHISKITDMESRLNIVMENLSKLI